MKTGNYLIALIFLLLGGCHNTNEPDELTPDPAIVFGESIARVKIGDDSSTVVKKLGRPQGIGYGDFKGYIFEYTEGVFAQTSVIISEDEYLGLGVIGMNVYGNYKGKSKDGIGINSEREFVISRLGAPDTTQDETPKYDLYYYDKNTFGIAYDNQHILRINMRTPKRK